MGDEGLYDFRRGSLGFRRGNRPHVGATIVTRRSWWVHGVVAGADIIRCKEGKKKKKKTRKVGKICLAKIRQLSGCTYVFILLNLT